MSLMISRGKEMIRISPKSALTIEVSINGGRTWNLRHKAGTGSGNLGEFVDLTDNGKEILAQTTRGLYYSRNEGRTWSKR